MELSANPKFSFTQRALFSIERSVHLSVPWYLSCSLAYYKYDLSLIKDEAYDEICKTLKDSWGTIEHRHKYLVDKSQLKAGTGYALDYDAFPTIVQASTNYLIREYLSRTGGSITLKE
jgi:hypothetical protein